MGLFSFLTSPKEKASDNIDLPELDALVIDLATFQIGNTRLGTAPTETDPFTTPLQKFGQIEASQGVELGTKNGMLDYAFLTLKNFKGKFASNGTPLNIDKTSTEATIKNLFGLPYWIDRSDGETIMFYLYNKGQVELQFEFPSSHSLEFITICQNGVLSCEKQRKSYGVNKPWPPK